MAQKDAAIKHLKTENSLLKQTSRWCEITYLKRSKAKMRSVHKRNEQLYKKREVRLKRNNALLQKQIHKLTEENEILRCELLSAEKMKSITTTKVDGKTYSTACCKTIYSRLEYHVPVANICKVIKAVLEQLAGQTVDLLPQPSTVSYFAYELGVISDIQIGEVMYTDDNITLSWDSTSVEGHHINEVHISIATIPPTSYVLQLSTLAGGATEDYVSHIHTCIDHIASTYAAYHNLDTIHVKSTFIHNLKNTLTDRVAGNHNVVQSLLSTLDIELLELKCNVHPLDGIAKKCTKTLKLYDTEYNIASDTYEKDCCVVNFIYAMTKM